MDKIEYDDFSLSHFITAVADMISNLEPKYKRDTTVKPYIKLTQEYKNEKKADHDSLGYLEDMLILLEKTVCREKWNKDNVGKRIG